MTTIEKLASVLYDLDPIDQQEHDPDWRPVGPVYRLTFDQAWEDDSVRKTLTEAVTAILQALREPAEGVRVAMIDASGRGRRDWISEYRGRGQHMLDQSIADKVLRAMIDAILAGEG